MTSYVDKINIILNELPAEDMNNFQVTYLTPNLPSGEMKYKFFGKKYPLKLQIERLGHLFNKRNIFFWLNLKYPQKRFSEENVEKCFAIFSLLLKKTNTTDGDSNLREFYYSKWHYNYGVFEQTRKSVINELFGAEDIGIICFNVDEAENDPEYVSTFKLTLEQKRNSVYSKFLNFSLIEIMESDWAYNTALKYLNSMPDFESTYDIFHNHFHLPKDLINHIASFLDST